MSISLSPQDNFNPTNPYPAYFNTEGFARNLENDLGSSIKEMNEAAQRSQAELKEAALGE